MHLKASQPAESRKISLRNSKSSTCQRHPAQTTCLPVVRRARVGSEQLTFSRRFGTEAPKLLGKSSRGLRNHYSEEFLTTKYRTSLSQKQRKVSSPKKPYDRLQQNEQDTKQTTRQHRKPKPKQTLLQNYWAVMDPDYRKYQLLSRKLPDNEPYDLDKLFRRKYRSYMNFLSLINFSNRITYQKRKKRHYTVFVDKGNNSSIVKHIFSTRFWWTIADSRNIPADLHWSQKKKQECINQMEKLEEAMKVTHVQVSENNRQSSHPVSKIVKGPRRSTLGEYLTLMNEADLQVALEKDLMERNRVKWREFRTIKGDYFKSKPVEFTHNHLKMGFEIGDKKQLFKNLKAYLQAQGRNPFQIIPLTYHIQDVNSPEFLSFKKHFQLKQQARKDNSKVRNIWIMKPGENSNRGNGIQVFRKLPDIVEHIGSTKSKLSERTFIIQQYIIPYLFFKRKFDIRCYMMITSGQSYRAYFYRDGYIRTSSQQFSLRKLSNRLIHLTNDAVQKKSEEYGKHEKGNKISFSEFQRYLDLTQPELNFQQMIYPLIKQSAADLVAATSEKMQNSKHYGFEIFGLDFMIDENFKPWLIEVNCNPCLQLSSPLLQVLIPSMLENSVRIAIDPIFPPPDMSEWPNSQKTGCFGLYLESNRYELIFDGAHSQRQQDHYKTTQQHRRESSKDDFSCSSSSLRRGD